MDYQNLLIRGEKSLTCSQKQKQKQDGCTNGRTDTWTDRRVGRNSDLDLSIGQKEYFVTDERTNERTDGQTEHGRTDVSVEIVI